MRKSSTPHKQQHASSNKPFSICNFFNAILTIVLGWVGFLYYCHISGHQVLQSDTSAAVAKLLPRKAATMLHLTDGGEAGAMDNTKLYPATDIVPVRGVSSQINRQFAKQVSRSDHAPLVEHPSAEVTRLVEPTASEPTVDADLHIAFSTDCSFFQDWQTLLIFHSAKQVGQKGSITRIASGCDDQKKADLVKLYRILHPEYGVHFTPDYKLSHKDGGKTKKKYDFYNKPFGVHHWLQNANPPVKKDTVVIILDPDMIFLRPITGSIAGNQNNIYMPYFVKQMSENPSLQPPARVKHGVPAAQLYGLHAPWATRKPTKNFNRTDICGEASPCLKWNEHNAHHHFSVGPPYMLEKEDLLALTSAWTKMVPRVYSRYPNLLAEMYAYSMAAAHTELPHFTLQNLMVSNTHADDEGWKWVDNLGDDVCEPPVDGVFYPGKPLPNVLHFCQFFRAGELGFQKRRVSISLFNCQKPIMQDPPRDLGKVDYKNRDGEILKLSRGQSRRNAFMLCVIHRAINAMVTDYKRKMCDSSKPINLNATINVVDPNYHR